jgi:hypothetical protein
MFMPSVSENLANGIGQGVYSPEMLSQFGSLGAEQSANVLSAGYNPLLTQGASEVGSGVLADGATASLGNQSMMGAAMPWLAGIGGAYAGYKTLDMIGDAPAGGRRNSQGALGGAASGAGIGTAILPGVGTAIGAGIGALAGLTASHFGSSKGEKQMGRDMFRKDLEKQGIIGKAQGSKQYLDLGNGQQYNIGADIGDKSMKGKKYIDPYSGKEMNMEAWQMDPNEQIKHEDSGTLGRALSIALGGTGETANAFGGHFQKAAIQSGNEKDFLKGQFDKIGGYEKGMTLFGQLANSGRMSHEEARGYQDSLNKAYGKDAYAKMGDVWNQREAGYNPFANNGGTFFQPNNGGVAPTPMGGGAPSGFSFDPSSANYKSLSKDQKNAYWTARNSGR